MSMTKIMGEVMPIHNQLVFQFSEDTTRKQFNRKTTGGVLVVEGGDKPDFTMSPLGDVIIFNGCIVGHSGRCAAQVALDVATQTELWRILTYHDPGADGPSFGVAPSGK